MPGGKRPHGSKSHSRDQRPVPRETSSLKKIEQKLWRRNCLEARLVEGRITPKNNKEATSLGIILS